MKKKAEVMPSTLLRLLLLLAVFASTVPHFRLPLPQVPVSLQL